MEKEERPKRIHGSPWEGERDFVGGMRPGGGMGTGGTRW